MRLTVSSKTHIRRYRKCENPKCRMSFRTKEELDETETNLKRTPEDINTDTKPNAIRRRHRGRRG